MSDLVDISNYWFSKADDKRSHPAAGALIGAGAGFATGVGIHAHGSAKQRGILAAHSKARKKIWRRAAAGSLLNAPLGLGYGAIKSNKNNKRTVAAMSANRLKHSKASLAALAGGTGLGALAGSAKRD